MEVKHMPKQLHLDLPDEIVVLLGDSKDLILEDPNLNSNLFEISEPYQLSSLAHEFHDTNESVTKNQINQAV